MGLEGISINQLRITPDNNSSELNNSNKTNFSEKKIVDGLSQSQRVLSNKQKDHDQNYNEDFSQQDKNSETNIQESTVKYDLSKVDKYSILVDEDELLIVEKSSNNIIQKINASELARFINFLPEPKGAIVNRKF